MTDFCLIFGALSTNVRAAHRFFNETKGLEALEYYHLEPEHHEERLMIGEIATNIVIAKSCRALIAYTCKHPPCPPPSSRLAGRIGCIVVDRKLLFAVCDDGPRAAFHTFKHEDLDYGEIGALEVIFNDDTRNTIEPLVTAIENELAKIKAKMLVHR